MNKSVMVLGGYGNFGKRICLALCKDNIEVIVVGRDAGKASAGIDEIKSRVPAAQISMEIFDIHTGLDAALKKLKPAVLIDTCGPFQGASYNIVKICIENHVHYLDLADARDFVTGITQLDDAAKREGVVVISGASSIPGLSSAVVSHFKNEFSEIDHLKYGISTAQTTANGLASASAILSYLGKPLKPFPGTKKTVYGWQDLYSQTYPVLGKRWMANCDVPDLDLLPKYFNIKNIQFSAGVESTAMHFCMWLTSWAIRLGLPINLSRHTRGIQKISRLFNLGCTNKSGMHVIIEGLDHNKKYKCVKWFIIAEYGEGLEIPTIPAIVLAKKILRGELNQTGARPCVDLISLEDYLANLTEFKVQVF